MRLQLAAPLQILPTGMPNDQEMHQTHAGTVQYYCVSQCPLVHGANIGGGDGGSEARVESCAMQGLVLLLSLYLGHIPPGR